MKYSLARRDIHMHIPTKFCWYQFHY